MENLPVELIVEIMLWLPVKSLLRLRCVCKSLRATIDSKRFINSHLKRCSEYGIRRKLIRLSEDKVGSRTKFHIFDIDDGFIEECLFSDWVPTGIRRMFLSYCNGLVLTGLVSYELSIWNPSTRQFRNLPTFPVRFPFHLRIRLSWYLGLGYDSTLDDYKVVLMTSISHSDIQVWVLELKSSCWRKVGDFPYVEYNHVEVGGNGDCYTDGALHFICYQSDRKSHIIVAFDVAKETFSEVLEPVYQIQRPTGYEIRLHVVAGCLCIVLFDCGTGRMDLYRRLKQGVEFTWIKLYSLAEQLHAEFFPYIRKGKLLECSEERGKLLLSCSGKLFWYNITERSLQEIKIKDGYVADYVFCIESLVPVGRQKWLPLGYEEWLQKHKAKGPTFFSFPI